jgi:hypothetical protein
MRIGYFTEAKLLFLTFSLSVHGAGYFLVVMILLSPPFSNYSEWEEIPHDNSSQHSCSSTSSVYTKQPEALLLCINESKLVHLIAVLPKEAHDPKPSRRRHRCTRSGQHPRRERPPR